MYQDPSSNTMTVVNGEGLARENSDKIHNGINHNVQTSGLHNHQQQQQQINVQFQQHQQDQIDQFYGIDSVSRIGENNGSSSFTLDGISAIMNNDDFSDLANHKDLQYINEPQHFNSLMVNNNQQVSRTPNQQHQEQTASISPNQLQNYNISPPAHEMAELEEIMMTAGIAQNHDYNQNHHHQNGKAKPYVEIIEQPAKCSLRFRYKCEERSAGSLAGATSNNSNKTFPSIKIHNHVGRAVVVISCVTKDAPYRAHPHNIVGKEGCKKGICTIVINNEPETVRSFPSLGIQCAKRKDIEESLILRESINVDPFRNGFSHRLNASDIDLNVVRLCFQVFIEGSTPNKYDLPLAPVVSEPIHDKKAMSQLVITKLSHCSAPATGGREIILLCDRICKDDIQVRFYEERNGKVVWETFTDLAPSDIHKQVAICFKTPKYCNEHIAQPVMARIQLKRVSDKQVSEPRMFQFLPCESDEDIISRKRQKIEWVNMNHYALDNILKPHQASHNPAQNINMNHHPIHHHHYQQNQHLSSQQQSQQNGQQHRDTTTAN